MLIHIRLKKKRRNISLQQPRSSSVILVIRFLLVCWLDVLTTLAVRPMDGVGAMWCSLLFIMPLGLALECQFSMPPSSHLCPLYLLSHCLSCHLFHIFLPPSLLQKPNLQRII